MKVACITPYYREPREILDRCVASVAAQSSACTHYLVSDGHPQDWIDELGARHVKLGVAHGDGGSAARGVGGLLAAAEGAQAIFYLDADNEIEPNHVALCLETASKNKKATYIIARRTIWVDGCRVDAVREEQGHVDTSCVFLLTPAFAMLATWALQPRELGPICDRIFYNTIRARGLRAAACPAPTVRFHSLYAVHYKAAGLQVPENAKSNFSMADISAWWSKLDEGERGRVRYLIECPGFMAGAA